MLRWLRRRARWPATPARVSGDAGLETRTRDADLERKNAALRTLLRELPVADRRVQRRRRQRVPRLRGDRRARRARALRHRRQSELSRPPPPARHSPGRASSASITRSSRPASWQRAEYRANPANRCYYCKHELYTHLTAIARERGIAVIADGSNADDRGDYRPGRQAAREFGVRSPLDEAGLTKDEIRELSRRAGLPTWDEPASACLSSRIPYFSEVTDEKLRMIERAEAVLRDLGFRVCRVRHHDTIARIELGRDEIARALEPGDADAIDRELRAIGYQHVTVDLRGYRLGSLNEALRLRPV